MQSISIKIGMVLIALTVLVSGIQAQDGRVIPPAPTAQYENENFPDPKIDEPGRVQFIFDDNSGESDLQAENQDVPLLSMSNASNEVKSGTAFESLFN